MRIKILLFISSLFLLSACHSPPVIKDASIFESFTVAFNTNPGQDKLEAHSDNQGCVQGIGAKKGCVAFAKNHFPGSTIGLSGEGNSGAVT